MEKIVLALNYEDGAQIAILDVLRWLGFKIKEISVNGENLPNLPYLLVGEKEYHGKDEVGEFIKEEREKIDRK